MHPEQRHFATIGDDGVKRVWFTARLWTLAKNLPAKAVPIDSISAFDLNTWFAYSEPTCRHIAEHAKRISEASLDYPVIISAEGYVMDGMHRICKAFILGSDTVSAVQFTQNPEPDQCIPENQPDLPR
jgi:hypothetical protein